ncbi:MAG TPA: copper amine oxidase N-terminal domain-containing protein, partial [Bacillota bacterium]|nr:copper amine oxidase N-terminal domain-containing protein [Bacillota bacterium]
EMYEKSGDLSSAIQTKEQEVQTNFTNLDSVKKLGNLYSKAGNTDVKTLINGHQSHFDTPPVIKDGHTLIPIRGVSESLKADVQWDSTAQTVTINRDGTTIVLTVGSNVATINGESVTLDAPSSIMNGRAFVPLRFISEALKAQVNWVPDGQIIDINDGSTPATDTTGTTPTTDTTGTTTSTDTTSTTPTTGTTGTTPSTDTTSTTPTTDTTGTTTSTDTTSTTPTTDTTGIQGIQ